MIEVNRSVESRLRSRPAWLNFYALVVAACLLITFSYRTVVESHESLQTNLESKLKTVLKIEAEAVGQWMKSRKQIAAYMAQDSDLVRLLTRKDVGQESNYVSTLAGISKKIGHQSCLLLDEDGVLLAASDRSWLSENVSGFEDLLCESFMSTEPAVSSVISRADKISQEDYAVIVAAPIRSSDDAILGFLGVVHDLNVAMTEVLKSSHSGTSGETLAVARSGQRISESRFPAAENRDSLFGELFADPSATVGSAIRVQLDGELDQRGVSCVYAVRWLPEFGFGLVAKMDREEAKAPVAKIEQFVWILFGFLLLSLCSTLFYRWYLLRMRLVARQAEMAGRRLGAYSLEEKIGEGNMGVVYRAKHELLRRPTAVKILPPEKSNDQSIERFETEVQFTSQLKHPNTISIYDYGRTENGLFYYAMELLDGLDLEALVQRDGPQPDGRVIQILSQCCASLREAHSLGLIHRDIKPANIMLCNQGGAVDTVKVLDFGMVRELSGPRTQGDPTLSGTPMYMAPESFTNPNAVDGRADIFALGAVAFFVLTGKPLFDVRSMDQLLRIHHAGADDWARKLFASARWQENAAISIDLVKLICDCVGPVERRPESVNEMLRRLKECKPVKPWAAETAGNWWKSSQGNGGGQMKSNRGSEPTLNSVTMSSLAKTQVFEPPAAEKPAEKKPVAGRKGRRAGSTDKGLENIC